LISGPYYRDPYKDGSWRCPEFAQRREMFLEILGAVDERTWIGVHYDPSNALVADDDPVDFLRVVLDRVVTMRASDRALAPEPPWMTCASTTALSATPRCCSTESSAGPERLSGHLRAAAQPPWRPIRRPCGCASCRSFVSGAGMD
jgi:hypothetical protein